MRSVRDVLREKSPSIWSTRPGATVFEAIAAMAEHEVGALLVMNDDDLVGIISERDYARKVILADKSSKGTLVSEIMTADVVSVDLRQSVHDCVQLMKNHHIRHLPVVEDGAVLGMVSLRDLFSTIIDEQATTIDHLEQYIRGEV